MRPATTLMVPALTLLACTTLLWASQSASDEGKGKADPHLEQTQHQTCQHGPHGDRARSERRGDTMGQFLERHADELGLDEATRASIDRIVSESRQRSQALWASRHQAERTLRDLIESDSVDRDAVMRQVETVSAIELEQRKLHVATKLDVRAQLTPKQRKQLDASRKSHKGGRHHGKSGVGEGAHCKAGQQGCAKCEHGAKCAGHEGAECEHGAKCAGPDGEKCEHGAKCAGHEGAKCPHQDTQTCEHGSSCPHRQAREGANEGGGD